MIISHDRFFLDRVCTHLLILEGGGATRWFVGNFRDYEESLEAEHSDRIAHRRGKYKRLTLK
jgi:ATPase subunit of ABC transporter with duplicated ATPase domains